MNKTIDIYNCIMYVYEEHKLGICFPVGMLQANKENYKIEDELEFLSAGLHFALPSDAIWKAEATIAEINEELNITPDYSELYIGTIEYSDTEEPLEDLMKIANTKLNIIDRLEKEDYHIYTIHQAFQNIEKIRRFTTPETLPDIPNKDEVIEIASESIELIKKVIITLNEHGYDLILYMDTHINGKKIIYQTNREMDEAECSLDNMIKVIENFYDIINQNNEFRELREIVEIIKKNDAKIKDLLV